MVSANPTGPLTVGSARNGAYGDAVARLLEFAGHEVEREYYFNDVGRQIELFRESVEARRRGEEPPEDGYTGEYVAEIAADEGDPVEQHAGRDQARARRVPDPLRHLGAPAGDRRCRSRTSCRSSRPTRRRERSGRERAAYGDDKDRPLVRSADGSYLYYAADVAYVRNKFERGFDRLDLRPRRRPPRLRRAAQGGRRDARLRPGAARGADLPARPHRRGRRGEADRPSGAATSSSSTSSWTRSASTLRAGTSSRADMTRRSTSTSTWRASGARRTPSTTSSTRTPGSRGS